MPRYSIMETPVLKKELDRSVSFGKAHSEQTLLLYVSRLSEVGNRRVCCGGPLWALVAGVSG